MHNKQVIQNSAHLQVNREERGHSKMKLPGSSSLRDEKHHLPIWQQPLFLLFWTGQSLSNLGDAFAAIAIPLLVLQVTKSVTQMGLVTALYGVGRFLAGTVSGLIVDQVDRKVFMIACDISRLFLYGSIPCIWFFAGPQLWLIYLVTVLGAVIGSGFQVAYVTVVVNIVDVEQMTMANSVLQGTLSLTYVLGPLLAGLISAWLGPAAAIGVDALSFGISVLSLFLMRFHSPTQTDVAALPQQDTRHANLTSTRKLRSTASSLKKYRLVPLELAQFSDYHSLNTPPAHTSAFRHIWVELLAGFHYLWWHPRLRIMMLVRMGAAVVLLTGGVSGTLDLFIFHLVHDLHQSEAAVGWVLGIASIGGIGGALLAPGLRRHLSFDLCWLGSIALAGLGVLGAGLAPTTALVIPSTILFTFGSTFGSICALSLRQELTPDKLLGRVNAALTTTSTITSTLGAILITNLANHLGASWSLSLAGGWIISLALFGLFITDRQYSSTK